MTMQWALVTWGLCLFSFVGGMVMHAVLAQGGSDERERR
jgi:hypothetical protein